MTKSLKSCFILSLIFSAILISWGTLSSFFSGVAVNFVAIIGIAITLTLISSKEQHTSNRVKDIIFVCFVFCVLEIVTYFACEFGSGETLFGFKVYQNIISSLGLIFMAYVSFRFWGDLTNKRFKFVETILGNEKRSPKLKKKTKELSNGCLEEKPNNQHQSNNNFSSETDSTDNVEIIISESEE